MPTYHFDPNQVSKFLRSAEIDIDEAKELFKSSNFDIDRANEFLKRSIEAVDDVGSYEVAMEIAKQVWKKIRNYLIVIEILYLVYRSTMALYGEDKDSVEFNKNLLKFCLETFFL